GGSATFKNSTDSTTAFAIQNSGSTNVFSVDTTNLQNTATNLQASGTLSVANNGASASLRAQLATSTVTASGYEITDVTRSSDKNTGGQGDGRNAPDSSYGIWEATTNLETNGGFETNTTGWSVYGTQTLSSSSERAKFGSKSGKATVVNTAENRLFFSSNYTLTNAAYTFSAWLYIPTAWDGGTIRLNSSGTFAGSTGTQSVNADMGLRDQWQRVSMTLTPAAGDLTGSISVEASATGATAGKFIYVDGFQVEQKSIATPYVETNGGTASRSAATVDSSVSSIDETQSWVAIRIRPNWASGTGPSSYPTLFKWADSGTERIIGYEISSSGSVVIERNSGGTNGIATKTGVSHTSGQLRTVIFAWTSSAVKVSVDGSAFTSAAQAVPPTLAASTFKLGYGDETSDSDILWTATGTGTLSDADAAAINRYGNSDPNVADLATTATSSTPTFVWKADNSNYQDTNPSYRAALQLDDTYLYRSGAGALTLQNATNSTTGFTVQNAAGTNLLVVNTTASQLAVGPSAVPANGVLTIGTDTTAASGGLYFGTDTNLYRSAANTLKTDDALQAASFGVGAAPRTGVVATAKIDAQSGGSVVGAEFVFPDAAGTGFGGALGYSTASTYLVLKAGGNNEKLRVYNDDKVLFGRGGTFDTNLYSSTTNTLKTDDAFVALGIDSGAGLLQGTGGLTLTGTTNLNATGTAASNIG
ncbi:hypothetical protein HY380_00405, partial [Candidatus Saccharibacteria bacterium]|nr:hypothetical protein [Candidatus Saccharibacteria bacterium]